MFSAIEKDSLRQAHSLILALLTALVFLSQGCMALPVRHPLPEQPLLMVILLFAVTDIALSAVSAALLIIATVFRHTCSLFG